MPFDSHLMRDAEVWQAHWAENDTSYLVQIGRPPTAPAAILYVLDGDILFAGAVQLARLMAVDITTAPIPQLLVVGIGWADVDGQAVFPTRRFRDFSPPGARLPGFVAPRFPDNFAMGGAPALHRFLEQVVDPFVRSAFADPPAPSLLFGYSYGGCFALHCLMSGSALFNRYIVGSPGVCTADDPLLRRADEWYGPTAPCHVVFTFGSIEIDGSNADYRAISRHGSELAVRLSTKPGLVCARFTLEGESHNSGPFRSLAVGLRTLLCQQDIGDRLPDVGGPAVQVAARDGRQAGSG